MTVVFWIGFGVEALVIAVLGLRALERQAQAERSGLPVGGVLKILKPVLLLAPLCAGGLTALLVLKIAWLAALIVWLPLVAVLAWALLGLIGGMSSGRWN
ncbi:MAG TPA: hypothetical protein VF950_08295 [Planctomycetota bacterium]